MRSLCITILLTLAVSTLACGAEPTPEKIFDSPLALPSDEATVAAESAILTALPTPRSGTGGAIGQLIDRTSGEPVTGKALFLGELSPLQTQDGDDSHVVMMLPNSSPTATIDQDGNFAFLDIEPNTYAIVVWTPTDSRVVVDPQTQKDLLITIEAGKTTDLGTIAIEVPR